MKRFLAMLLVVMMLVSLFPMAAFADPDAVVGPAGYEWDTLQFTDSEGNALVQGDDYTIASQTYNYLGEAIPSYNVYTITTDKDVVISGGGFNPDTRLASGCIKSTVVFATGSDANVTLNNVTCLGSLTAETGKTMNVTLVGENYVDSILGDDGVGQTSLVFGGQGTLNGKHIGGSSLYGKTTTSASITINSGTYNLDVGSDRYAAIGGGYSGSESVKTYADGITINGGYINAKGGYGAAIGGGQYGDAYNITITGGTIIAKGSFGAGIGSGMGQDDSADPAAFNMAKNIVISGGTVDATATAQSGAAIGGGSYAGVDGITITGGVIKASTASQSSFVGAAIGGGSPFTLDGYKTFNVPPVSNIKISGANITASATGKDPWSRQIKGNVIGSGYFNNGSTKTAQEATNIVIESGSFNFDPSAFISEGYIVTGDAENGYTVAADPTNPVWAAQIGSKYYTSLEAAMAAAKSEDTIKLLRDVELKNTLSLTDGVVLDGQGFEIACSEADDSYFVGENSMKNAANSAKALLDLAANKSATVKDATLTTKAYARYNIGNAATSTLTLEDVVLNHIEYSARGNDGIQLNGALIVKGDLTINMGSNVRYWKDKNGGEVPDGFTNRAWGGISFNNETCSITFEDGATFTMTDGGTAVAGEEAYGLTQAPIHLYPYDAAQWDRVSGWDQINGLVKVYGVNNNHFGFAFEGSDYLARNNFTIVYDGVYYQTLNGVKTVNGELKSGVITTTASAEDVAAIVAPGYVAEAVDGGYKIGPKMEVTTEQGKDIGVDVGTEITQNGEASEEITDDAEKQAAGAYAEKFSGGNASKVVELTEEVKQMADALTMDDIEELAETNGNKTELKKALDDAKEAADKDDVVSIKTVVTTDTKVVVNGIKEQEKTVGDQTVNTKTFALDITPVYSISIITTINDIEGEPVPVVTEEKLEVTGTKVVTIPAPEGFVFEEGMKLYVKHTKDDGTTYTYEASYNKTNKTISFTNDHGFSNFDFVVESIPAVGPDEDPYIAAVIHADNSFNYYKDLQAAFDAAMNNETVLLLDDYTNTKTAEDLYIAKNIIFDLGGKTLEGTDRTGVLGVSGKAIIENGTIKTRATGMTVYAVKLSNGTLTVRDDVDFVIDVDVESKYAIYDSTNFSTVNLADGTYLGIVAAKNVNISGGTYNGQILAGNTLVISGGTFNGDIELTNNVTCSITGGVFNNKNASVNVYANTVSGGSFEKKLDTSKLAEGYCFTALGAVVNDYYTVVEAVAQDAKGNLYATVKEAVDADKGEVTLLKDASYALELNKEATINVPTGLTLTTSAPAGFEVKQVGNVYSLELLAPTVSADVNEVYTGSPFTLTASSDAQDVTFKWYKSGNGQNDVYVDDGATLNVTNVDDTALYFAKAFVGAYESDFSTGVNVTITKADLEYDVIPAANTLTYNGEDQALVDAATLVAVGVMTDVDIVYSLSADGEFTTAIPVGKNAGEYNVYYKVNGGANHNDIVVCETPVTVTIAPKAATIDVESYSIVAGMSQTYNGTVTGLVKDGDLGTVTYTSEYVPNQDSYPVSSYEITANYTDNSNYTVQLNKGTLTLGSAAARIGTTYYATFEEALAEAVDDDTIVLLADLVATMPDNNNYANHPVWSIEKNITIDGNGKKVTIGEPWQQFNNGKTGNIFSIGTPITKDEKDVTATIKNLTIVGNDKMKNGISVVSEKGKTDVILENVVISGCGAQSVVCNNSEVVIKGANTNIANGGWGTAVDVGYANADLTIENGNIALVKVEGGEAEVTGGTVETVAVTGADAAATVSGGTVETVYVEAGEAAVTGGTVSTLAVAGGEAAVTGGTVGTVNVVSGEATVSGGTVTNTTAAARIGNVYYGTLAEAVAAVPANGAEATEIVMLANTTVETKIAINDGKNIALNLNGKNISTGATNDLFAIENAKLNLTGTGEVQLNSNYLKGSANEYYGIKLKGSQTDVADYTVLTVGAGVTIKGGDTYGASIANNNGHGYGVVVDIYGRIETNYGFTLNGNIVDKTENVPVITVKPGAYLAGPYAAGYGIWNVYGTMEGADSGFATKAGVLNVYDGAVIRCTGEDTTPTESYGSGIEASGAAIQIESNNGYAGDIEINIYGGTIESVNGVAFYEYRENSTTSTKIKSLDIEGGSISSGNTEKATDFLVPADFAITGFISGGTFTNPVALEYCAPTFHPVKNADGTYGVATGAAVASITTGSEIAYFASLADAIASVTDSTPTTITMIADVDAAHGISVPGGRNITVNFANHSYKVEKPGAGSPNTKTQAFQLLEGSSIKFMNGTISCTAANKDFTWTSTDAEKGVAMIIQNYANLTLENMTIDATNIAHNGNNVRYAMSINSGNVVLENTKITVPTGDYAFDTCKYSTSAREYPVPNVQVKGNSEFTGNVELTGGKLNVTGGTFNGSFVEGSGYTAGDVDISGGSFKDQVKYEYCADGYMPAQKNEQGMYTVENSTAVAVVTGTGKDPVYYTDFYTAFQASTTVAGDTIKLLADVNLDVDHNQGILMYNKNVNIDGQNHTIKYVSTTHTNGNGPMMFAMAANGGTIKISNTKFDANRSGCSRAIDVFASYGSNFSSWTFDNCEFTNCRRAIEAKGALTINNCKFNDCSSQAVSFQQRATTLDWTITNNEFANCPVKAFDNGANTKGIIFTGNIVDDKSPVIVATANANDFTGNTFNGGYVEVEVKDTVTGSLTGNTFNGKDGANNTLLIWQKSETASKDTYTIDTHGGSYLIYAYEGTELDITEAIFDVPDTDDDPITLFQVMFINGSSNVILPEGFVAFYNSENPENVYDVQLISNAFAKIGNVYYRTLAEAVAVAKDGDTVELLKNATGDGIQIEKDKFATGLTIDLGGFTYTADNPVGSTGTVNQAMQLNKGNKITVKNGTVTTAADQSGLFKFVIQNYSDLTLDDVTLDGQNLGKAATNYVLSNNNGDTVLKNGTKLLANEGDVAYDLYDYASQHYTGVSIEIDNTVTVTGAVEVGGDRSGEAYKIAAKVPAGMLPAAPANYVWIDGEDGFKKIATAVAKIGDTYFYTLQGAIDAAQNGNVIVMLENVNENVTVHAGLTVTLDLNGKTIDGGTVANSPAITNNGNLTVTGAGTIKRGDTGASGYYVIKNPAGTLTFDANFTGTVTNGSGLTTSHAGASVIDNGSDAAVGTLNIMNGTFTQENFNVIKTEEQSEINISGGTISSNLDYAILSYDEVNISGGNVNGSVCTRTYGNLPAAETNITGGTITGNVISAKYDSSAVSAPVVSISDDAVVNGSVMTVDPQNNKAVAGNFAISGGTFSAKPDNSFFVAGCAPVQSGDVWVVGTSVATIGAAQYATLAEAVAAAVNGDTVTMVADDTINSAITISDKAVTVDLNGNTVQGDNNGKRFVVDGTGSLTLADNKGTGALKGGESGDSVIVKVADNGAFVLDGAAISDATYGVCAWGNGTIEIKSGSITTVQAAVCTNGNGGNQVVTISGGELTSTGTNVKDNVAVYIPSGTATITGGTMTGATGVYVKGGTVTIPEGSTAVIKGNGAEADYVHYAGSVTATGDALVLENSNYPAAPPTLSIAGGSFESVYGEAVASYGMNDTYSALGNFISGGEFKGAPANDLFVAGAAPVAKQNAEGWFVVGNAVATIGAAQYATLAEAVAAAADGETVTMVADDTITSAITISDKAVTVDLNGNTVQGDNNGKRFVVSGTGSLTLADNKGTGALKGGESGDSVIVKVADNGAFVLDGAAISDATYGVCAWGNGTIEIKSGSITTVQAAVCTNGNGGNQVVTISGGTLTSTGTNVKDNVAVYIPSGTATITGGTMTGATGVYVKGGKVTISDDAVIKANGAVAEYKHGTGSVTATGDALVLENSNYPKAPPELSVTGGSFESVYGEAVASYGMNDTYSALGNFISGGEFKGAPANDLFVEGKAPVGKTGAEGWFVVGNAVATIGAAQYATLAEAVAAAVNGDVIKLLDNASGSGIEIDKSVTIDFNNHTYTATGNPAGSTGTKNQVFQILPGNTVTMNDGTVEVADDVANQFRFIIQDYASLNLNNMVLDGSNLALTTPGRTDTYALCVNSGTVAIDGSELIGSGVNGINGIALDTSLEGSYARPNVTVNGTTLDGVVSLNGGNLALVSGTLDGELVNGIYGGIGDSNVTKSNGFMAAAPDGYMWNVNGKLVPVTTAVAQNEQTGKTYATLEEALDEAVSGQKVFLLADIVGEKYVIVENGITLDLVGYDITGAKLIYATGTIMDSMTTIETKGTVSAAAYMFPDSTDGDDYYYLPIGTGSGYQFYHLRLTATWTKGTNTFNFNPNTDTSRVGFERTEAYKLLSEGYESSRVKAVVTLTWTADAEKGTIGKQVFTFSDNFMQEVANNSRSFQIAFTGIDELADLSVQAHFITCGPMDKELNTMNGAPISIS